MNGDNTIFQSLLTKIKIKVIKAVEKKTGII